MKRFELQSFFVLSFLIFATFGVIVTTSFINTRSRATISSQAQEENIIDLPYCPATISATVYELINGEEIILDFSQHSDTNYKKWGIVDEKLLNSELIQFNQGSLAQYKNHSNQLSFIELPEVYQAYNEGDETFAQLTYQENLFNIVKQEIRTCGISGDNEWLCLPQEDFQNLDVISRLPMQCGIHLDFSWTVEKNIQNTAGQNNFRTEGIGNDINPVEVCDLNNDSVCNTFDLFMVIDQYGKRGVDLVGDANDDGVVNALDYTLVSPSK